MLLQVDSSPIILARRLTENSNQPCSNFAVSWRGQEATPTDNKGNYPKSIEREYSFLSQFGEESKPICSLDRIVKFDREIVFFFFFFFPSLFLFQLAKKTRYLLADIFIYRESRLLGGNIKNVPSWKRENAAKKGDRL